MPTSLKSVSESPYAVGDIVMSAKGSPGTNYVATDGSVYTKAAKPLLAAAVGSIVNVERSAPAIGALTTARQWNAVAYGAGIAVAVCSDPSSGLVQPSSAYVTSTDGINWTQRTFPVSAAWGGIAYGNGLFVVTASFNAGTVFMTSPDGINWTQRAYTVAQTPSTMTFINGMFIMGTYNTTKIATSTDGLTWTQRTMPISGIWSKFAYGNGVYVAVSNQTTYATSIDGVTWNTVTWPANVALLPSAAYLSIAFGNGKFVLMTREASYTSVDGLAWTENKMIVVPNLTSSYIHQCFGVTLFVSGVFVAISTCLSDTQYSNYLTWSSDGINWTSFNSGQANGAAQWGSAVAMGDNILLVSGSPGTGSTSVPYTKSALISMYSYNKAAEFIVPKVPYGYIKFSDVV